MISIVHIVLNRSIPAQMPVVHRTVRFLAEAESRLGMEIRVWEIGTDLMAGDIEKVDHLSFDIQSNRLRISSALKKALDKLPENSIIHIHGGFVPEYFAISRYLRKTKRKIRM